MTGIVKHAENAVKARQDLARVKAEATEVIGGMLALIKGMWLFGADELKAMNFEGRPVSDVVADLWAAESAQDFMRALAPPPPLTVEAPNDGR